MSIEFRCQQCQHLQQFDESKIGQQVYCRVCYFKLTVPAESTIKPVDESQLYTLAEKSWNIQEQQELISFRCDICNTIIGVRKEQVGEEIACAECGTKIIVPKSIAAIAEARFKDKLDRAVHVSMPMTRGATYSLSDGTTVQSDYWVKQFRFFCQLCGTTLFATEEQVGSDITCPDCNTKTKVPPPPKKSDTPSLPPTAFEGDTVYKIATHSRVGAKETVVPVVCHACKTRMYANESQIGKFITCPDCGQQTEIKEVLKQPITKTETTSADAYGLNKDKKPTPRPARFFRSFSPSILRKRLNEWESCRSLNRPPLPKRPLTERFFVPFGFPDTWLPVVLFIVVIPLGTLPLYWAASATEGGDRIGTFGYAIFVVSVGAAICTMFVAAYCYFASFLVHLYSFTSSGMDEEEFKGELVPFDYFIVGLWLFMFSLVATVPGFLLGTFLDQPVLLVVAMRVSYWFFFPIFFLSSLEVGSMFAIFAKNILMSLFRLPFAWLRFFFLTGILFALSDICLVFAVGLASTCSLSLLGITLVFLFFAIQSLFFFRLLGRHAWLIEETYRQGRELEEESIVLKT